MDRERYGQAPQARVGQMEAADLFCKVKLAFLFCFGCDG